MARGLFNRGFVALLTTQFFGAVGEFTLKGILSFMVIDGAWREHLTPGGQGLVGLCFSLPFILFSGYAGQFCDRRGKRTVAVLVKAAEIPIATVAMIGFLLGNLWIALAALLLLTSQTAFFIPLKYGVIPELVDERDLSRANGVLNLVTNLAVISGAILSGVMSDQYAPRPGPHNDLVAAPMLWLPGAALLTLAMVSFVSSLLLPGLPAREPTLRYEANPLWTYVRSLRRMAGSPLLHVTIAWGLFYLLVGIALLVIPEYTRVLDVDRTEASLLLGVVAVSVGAGSMAAGLVSGGRIRHRLIPWGGAGMTLFFTLLAFVPPSTAGDTHAIRVLASSPSFFLFGAGFCGGFFMVPLQALLQRLPASHERGRLLATANCVSFGSFALASLAFWLIRPLFDQPQRIFMVSASLMALGTFMLLLYLRRRAIEEASAGWNGAGPSTGDCASIAAVESIPRP